MQVISINQFKLEVHDTYQKHEITTTFFQPTDDKNVINKAYLDEKLVTTNGHLSFSEKDYKEFILQNNKQSPEDF